VSVLFIHLFILLRLGVTYKKKKHKKNIPSDGQDGWCTFGWPRRQGQQQGHRGQLDFFNEERQLALRTVPPNTDVFLQRLSIGKK